MRAHLALFLSLLSAACSSRSFLELPANSGQSFILAFESGDQWTIGAESTAAPLHLTGLESEADVFLFTYDRTLQELALSSGAVPSADRCARPCALLAPSGLFTARVVGGEPQTEWKVITEVPQTIAEQLVPDRARCVSPCVPLTQRVISLETNAVAIFVARLDDDHGLIVLDNGRIMRVGSGGSVDLFCDGLGAVKAGFSVPGALWIFGDRFGKTDLASVMRGGQCPIEEMPAPDPMTRWMDGSQGNAPLEIFALTATGAVSRFDGARWEQGGHIDLRLRDQMAGHSEIGAVAWGGPNRAVAVIGSDQVARWTGGPRVEIDRVRTNLELAAIETVIRRADNSFIIALDNDGLAEQSGDGWRLFIGGRRWDHLPFVVELGPRLVFGSANVIGQWVNGFGYCEDQPLPVPAVPRIGGAISERALLVGRIANSELPGPTQVLWVEHEADCR